MAQGVFILSKAECRDRVRRVHTSHDSVAVPEKLGDSANTDGRVKYIECKVVLRIVHRGVGKRRKKKRASAIVSPDIAKEIQDNYEQPDDKKDSKQPELVIKD